MIQGNPKFDGLAVAKISIDYLQNPIHIDVQAAFVNVKTGDTHGWTRGFTSWSDKTRLLMSELRLSMETDLAERHFEGGGTDVSMASAPRTRAPGGIGEQLGTAYDTNDTAPSV